jgi:hypothetical protein
MKKKLSLFSFSIIRALFLSLSHSVECTCSDSLEDLHRIDSKMCNLKCHGNRKQTCGGSQEGVFSIYSKNFGNLNLKIAHQQQPV